MSLFGIKFGSNKATVTSGAIAAAGGLINTTGIALLSAVGGVTVHLNTVGKQALYTVPVGKRCVVTEAIARDASTDLTLYSDIASIGFNVGADDVGGWNWDDVCPLVNGTVWMGATMNGFIQGTGAASVTGVTGDILGFLSGDTSITATVKIDIFGYLIDA